jgi:hypothetical protein
VTTDQFFLELYKEQTAHGRHTEMQRQQMTQLILTISTALLGVMAALKFSIHCLPLALAMIYLGSFGRRFTLAYVERFDGHMSRARALRKAVDQQVASGGAQNIFDNNPVTKSTRLREFWLGLHRAIQILGAICVIVNLLAVGTRIENWKDPLTGITRQLQLQEPKK